MRIGIFSGSFNPIHTGHLIIANYICEFEQLDEVWFIVTPQNPLKEKASLADDLHRVNMVKEAIGNNPKFRFCDIEFRLPLPSYTINTLETLQKEFPQHIFTLLIGADNWTIFDNWKDSKKIRQDFQIMIYPRYGYEIKKEEIPEPNIRIAKSPFIEVSSTFIRDGISRGKNMNYFIPANVYEYINSHSLYK